GMVLLKNEGNILPLDIDRIKKIAIVGKHAGLKFGRSKLGGGSSAVLPPYEITIREGLKARCRGKIEIVDDPASADVAIACVGLEHTHDFKGGDHEGSDRLRYGLGFKQNRLVQQCVDQNPNTIVVCVNGQPFSVEKFQARVPAILEAWYGGMEIGSSVAAILLGDVNPSGKLPVSWPREKRDIPTALSFLKTVFGPKQVSYDEGVFIGYRYFDTKGEKDGRQVRFCFGHGLSYTNFSFGPISMSTHEILDDEICKISCPIKNDGVTSGAEIVQLYVEPVNPPMNRPVKELKGFQKIFLSPSEDNMVTFLLDKRSFSCFNEERGIWVAEEGEYKVLLGSSSGDIRKACGVTYGNN
ncbi:hypothetical protein GF325_11445, partial [Candidatus Bathyarchaeota archaeon]|nr:hypothetical protein [Candidatus Bathyarchaeota archaeon]